jgi:hypothetical protein
VISNTASPCKALTGFRGSLRHVRLGANNGGISDDVGVGRGEIRAPKLEPRRRDALMTSWQQTTSRPSSCRQSDYGCALMSPRPVVAPVRGCRGCLPGSSLKVRGSTRMSSSENVPRLRPFIAYSVTYSAEWVIRRTSM